MHRIKQRIVHSCMMHKLDTNLATTSRLAKTTPSREVRSRKPEGQDVRLLLRRRHPTYVDGRMIALFDRSKTKTTRDIMGSIKNKAILKLRRVRIWRGPYRYENACRRDS